MAFQVFTQTGTRTKEFISVTETKVFGLSRAYLDKYHVAGSQKAVILNDPDTNSVALHFSDNDPKFGFAIRISNDKHGATIMAKSFFDVKGLDAKQYAGRYTEFEKNQLSELGTTDKEGAAFVFALKERKPEPEADEPPLEFVLQPDDVIIDDIAEEPTKLDDIPL